MRRKLTSKEKAERKAIQIVSEWESNELSVLLPLYSYNRLVERVAKALARAMSQGGRKR